MKYIFYYIVIFITCYCIFTTCGAHEYFTIVAYNTAYIPKYTIPNLFDIETVQIQKKLFKASIDHDIDTTITQTISASSPKIYSLYNNNLLFPFSNQFKKLIEDFLKIHLTTDKLQISDPRNIYWKNDSYDRIFIFHTSMRNIDNFTSKNLIVKIKVKNIGEFFENNSLEYSSRIHPQHILDNSIILNISLDTTNFTTRISTFNGIDTYKPNHYEIQNHLSLLDPFYTSGNSMIITKDMKDKFDISLQQHEQLQLTNSLY